MNHSRSTLVDPPRAGAGGDRLYPFAFLDDDGTAQAATVGGPTDEVVARAPVATADLVRPLDRHPEPFVGTPPCR